MARLGGGGGDSTRQPKSDQRLYWAFLDPNPSSENKGFLGNTSFVNKDQN